MEAYFHLVDYLLSVLSTHYSPSLSCSLPLPYRLSLFLVPAGAKCSNYPFILWSFHIFQPPSPNICSFLCAGGPMSRPIAGVPLFETRVKRTLFFRRKGLQRIFPGAYGAQTFCLSKGGLGLKKSTFSFKLLSLNSHYITPSTIPLLFRGCTNTAMPSGNH